MVGATGIEPVTPSVSGRCSPAELRAPPAGSRCLARPVMLSQGCCRGRFDGCGDRAFHEIHHVHLIAIGRLREGPEAALFERYAARLRPRLTLTELHEARGAPAEVKRREGAALLAALPRGAFAVALDPGGPALTSEQLAGRVEQWLASRPDAVFPDRRCGRARRRGPAAERFRAVAGRDDMAALPGAGDAC